MKKNIINIRKKCLNLQALFFMKSNNTKKKNMKKNCSKWLYLLVFIASLFLGKNEVKASHVMGADITYKMIDTVNGVYEFTLTRYRYCGGINFSSNQLNIVSSQFNVMVPMTLIATETSEVTPLCLPPDVPAKKLTHCPGPNAAPLAPDFIKGVMKEVLKCTYTVGRNIGPAYAGYEECCRNTITTLTTSPSLYVQTAFNTNYVNNSVIFTNYPVPYWCKGKVNTYAHGPADTFDPKYVTVNGKTVVRDSISFVRYTPWFGPAANPNLAFQLLNQPVTFVSPLNATNFLFTTSGVTMDPFTGLISAQPDRDQDAVMAVAIFEWRAVANSNGVGYSREFLGYVCRDLQFSVRDNCDPVFDVGSIKDSMYGVNQLSSYFIEVCGRQPGKLQFKAIGAVNQNMKLSEVASNKSASKDLVNYKFTTLKVTKAGVDTMYGTVTFDSAVGSGDERLIFDFYYCNNYGMKVSREIAVRIRYMQSMILDKDTGYYCPGGKPVRITSKTSKKVSWSPKTGIVGSGPGTDSTWIDVTPAANTSYLARSLDLDSVETCTIYDSTLVRVIPPFTYNLSPKTRDICLNDTFPIVLTTQVTDTPYKYTWLNSNGALFNPSTKKEVTNISSPTVYAINSENYIVEMENRYGCILVDTVKVSLKGVKPNARATSQRTYICPGDTTLLSAIITPLTCGLTIYKSNAQLTTANIAAGSVNYPTVGCSGAGCYPNIYGTNGLGNSSNTKILYTKAQLTAAGARAGILKTIAFNLIEANVSSFESFTIKMGATTGTSANAIVPMFTVFNTKPINTTVGWNTYTFDRGYDWDGNSNLIVEICIKKNAATFLVNRYLTNISPGGNEVFYRLSNTVGVDACGMTTNYIAAGGTQAKPHTRFTVTGVDSSDAQFSSSWAPSYLINTVLPAPSKPRTIINASQTDSLFTITYGSSLCFDTGVVKVKADTNFKVKASGSKVVCRQASGGSPIPLTATITSSQAYTLTWTSTPNDPSMSATNTPNITVNPSTPGTYRYVVKISASPCEATDTVYVTVQDSLTFSLTSIQPTCTGTNGSISAVLPSGSKISDFNYVWTPNVSDSTRAVNLGANTYKLEVQLKTDATCKGSQILNLPALLIPLNITTTASSIACNGGNSDSIVASVNTPASPGPYKYSWSSNPTSDTFYKINNKVSGAYTVTVTDKLTGCSGNQTINVIQPSPLALTFTKIDVNCKGDNTGYAKAFPSGGTPNNGFYTYTWTSTNGKNSSLPTFQDQFSLYADSLNVTVTDKNGCTITRGVRIIEPLDSLKVALTTENATSVKGTDGKAFAVVTGGSANYNYKWDTSTFNPTTWFNIKNSTNIGGLDSVTGRAKSMIRVEVTDSKGCKVRDSAKIQDIVCDIVAQFNKVDVNCFGDSTGMLNFGAIDNKNDATTSLYTYVLSENISKKVIGTLTSPIATPPAALQSFTNLKAGIYDVKVKTNKGCDTDFVKLVTINQNPKIVVNSLVTDPSCLGYTDGKVNISVVDNFTPFEYSWNGGAFVPNKDSNTNLAKGTYIDTVKNSLGCKLPFSYQLKDPAGISIANTLKKGISCNGLSDGQVEINVTPSISVSGKPYEYYAKPGTNQDSSSNILDSLSAGAKTLNVVYYTTATATTSCMLSYNFNMIEPTKLVLTGSKTDVTCSYNKDGQITLNANNTGTSNYTYEIVRISTGQSNLQNNVPSNTFMSLDSGIYNAFVTDKNGCRDSMVGANTLKVGKPSPLKPKINVTPASCITSNNGSLKIDTLNAGSNGGYSAITTLTPNFTNPKTSFTPNALKGLESYRVIVSDKLGCRDTQVVFVDTIYDLRITQALKMDSVSCFGLNDGKLTLNITSLVPNNGGLQFAWSNSGSISNVLTASAGTYNLTVTDGNNCSASTLGTIEEPSEIVIVGKMKEISCYKGEDGTVKIAVAGGRPPYQYAWSPLNQNTDSAIGLKAGINTVTVTDSKNCQNTQSFDMPQPAPFIAHIDTVKHISCFGANDGKIVLRIEGGKPQYNYTWNLDARNAASIDNLIPNISYKVTVTDILGCIAKAETEVKEPLKLELESLKVDSLSCPKSNDGRISIQVKGGTITAINQYDYSINGGNTYEKTNVFEKLPASEYTVIAKDNNGCMVSKKVTVLAPEELFVSAKINGLDTIVMGNTTELYYDKRTLSNTLPIINSQLWTPNESLSCANCVRTQAMPYISEIYNLEVYYHKNCKAISKVKVVVKEPLDFYVPNAFSPGNQDGVNDMLKLYGNSIKSIKFAVFNRWGEKVFESETQENGWDGNYKGEPAPGGTYTYVAEVTYLNNLVKNKKGSITLIR